MPQPLTPENTRTTLINGQRVYLVKVARAQRALIYIVCGMLLVNGGGLFALATLGGVGGPTTSWMIIVTAIISLNVALAVAGIVQTLRLAVAAGTHIAVAIFAGIFLFVPWIGLIIVVFINVYATKVLTTNAVAVGFFGVTADEMKKLVIGACTHCGYDIRGLPSPQCPECGTPISDPEPLAPGVFSPAKL